MIERRHVDVLRALLTAPTASFHEQEVVEQVQRWAAARGAAVKRDRAGNLLLRYSRGRGSRNKWVFAAHMDHPGFAVRSAKGRVVHADFLGYINKEYFRNGRVRFFAPGGEVCGTITSARRSRASPIPRARVTLDEPAAVPPGTIGMWDVTDFAIRRRRIVSRACDDVAGVASVLCAMEEIIARKLTCDVTGLLTRAEESGFVGAIGACKYRTLPADALVVAIETSKAQPAAPLGCGAVVRVGDRSRTFDPTLTAYVSLAAHELATKDNKFRYSRQLMPGGTCESTVYMAFGYRTAALCVPLANYHNQGPRGKVEAEAIDAGDFACLVKLLVALAAHREPVESVDRQLRKRLAALFSQHRPML